MDNSVPQDVPQQQCSVCEKSFPLTAKYFHHDKKRKCGFMAQCKVCRCKKKKEWADNHREQINISARGYYQGKREYILLYQKEYIERPGARARVNANNVKNPRRREQSNAKNRLRRALKRGSGGKHTPQDVQKQYVNQKGKCYYCKKKVGKVYHVDHVIPLIRGGSNGPENIVIACPTCNLRKNDKMPHEWAEGGRLL